MTKTGGDRAGREGTGIQRVWVNQTFELGELTLGQLGLHKCSGLMTKKITVKLVGDCNNHTALLTQKRKWTATRQQDIERTGPGICGTAIRILGFIPLGDDRIRKRCIDLMTFDVDPDQPRLLERHFGHPFKFTLGIKGDSNIPLFRMKFLIFPPHGRIGPTGPLVGNAS